MAVWAATALGFVAAYGFLFTVVHPFIDSRPCVARLPDPLFPLIPYDGRWYLISHQLFYVVTAATLAALFFQVARGEHRPLVRFAAGISLQALFRSVTMALLPICKATIEPGHPGATHIDTLNLGFARVPWRAWATNDLIFSGHVGEFLILYFAVRAFWPRWGLIGLIVFQVLEAIALVATRGHYTVDIVIAIPFAFFTDRLIVATLARTGRAKHALV